MARDAIPETRQRTVEPLDDDVDHVRGPSAGHTPPSSGSASHASSRIGRVRTSRDAFAGTSRGTATGQVQGTPTLFIDGVVHLGGYDEATLLEALRG
jgi:hypothetical protein